MASSENISLLERSSPGPLSRSAWRAEALRAGAESAAPVHTVVIHHTGESAAHLRDGGLEAEAAEMRRLQARHFDRGWADIGYHLVVMPSGRTFEGRDDALMGAHVRGRNRGTFGVALAGDYMRETPAPRAVLALRRAVLAHPQAAVVGHGDLAPVRCPGTLLRAALSDLLSASDPEAPGSPRIA